MDISPNYAGTINGVAMGLGFAPAVLTSEMLGNIIKGNVSMHFTNVSQNKCSVCLLRNRNKSLYQATYLHIIELSIRYPFSSHLFCFFLRCERHPF